MPEGIRCNTVFLPPITSVWPALCPPWKRTTPCAWSVSQSTILPLPSSPHWVPITTTFLAITKLPILKNLKGDDLPGAIAQHQLAIALQLPAQGRITKQINYHRLTRRAQLCNLVAQYGIVEQRRTNAQLHHLRCPQAVQLAQVHAESGRGVPGPPRPAPEFVAASPPHQP